MSKGRPAHRSKRARGWLSGSKGSAGRKAMPLWQWFVVIPVLLILLAGITLFAYLTMVNPKMGAGVRTVTAVVQERVESRAVDGSLDTSASYIVVSVEQTRLKLAPRLPDWDRVAKGDVVDVEVSGKGSGVQAYSWKAAPKRSR